jgi:aminopeptidase N
MLCGLALLATTSRAFTGEHYELALRPDFDSHVLYGSARIRLKFGPNPAQALELPSPTLQITRARLDGQDIAVEKTATGWHMALTTVQAKAPILWLELDYQAPAAGGLVFDEHDVYTAFHTCQWMPCAGPELSRASIAITLELPEGYRSVASGRRVADASAGKQRWLETQPYPLYTLGFSAGLFTEILDDASRQRLRYLGANEDEAALRAKFKDSALVLAFFEKMAGLPLPHPVYTQVLVPGGVAQEASSFSLIGKLMLDPILEDPQEDWAIAHEMAHQWWGNLITCAAWNEFWLNEGITVFMTATWKQQRWGEAAYQGEMNLARKRWQLAKDAGFDKPLSWSGDYPSLSVMRSIHYSKGALFMDALRHEIG